MLITLLLQIATNIIASLFHIYNLKATGRGFAIPEPTGTAPSQSP